jgi:hypothetical protein
VVEVLHGGMLIPALVSLCCAAGGPRAGRRTGIVVGAAMVLAMVDHTSEQPAVPAGAWAALLVLLALVSCAATSVRFRNAHVPGVLTMSTHRGLGLVLTSALLLFGQVATVPPAETGLVGIHAHGISGSGIELLMLLAVAAYVVFSATVIRRGLHAQPLRNRDRQNVRLRQRLRDGTVDAASMATATVAMTLLTVVPG